MAKDITPDIEVHLIITPCFDDESDEERDKEERDQAEENEKKY